jgi:hypothetical protein
VGNKITTEILNADQPRTTSIDNAFPSALARGSDELLLIVFWIQLVQPTPILSEFHQLL